VLTPSRLLDDAEVREILSVSEEIFRGLLRDTPPGCARPFVVISAVAGREHRRWYPDLKPLWGWLQEVERWRGSNRGKQADTASSGATGKGAAPSGAGATPQTSGALTLSSDASSPTSPSTGASPSTTARTRRPLFTRV
jgi:hypothetical protein